MFWVSYDSLVLPEKNVLYYGSTVSLDDLHQYFTNVDKSSNTYAYVFTKEGICITHPEKNTLENVFLILQILNQKTRFAQKLNPVIRKKQPFQNILE